MSRTTLSGLATALVAHKVDHYTGTGELTGIGRLGGGYTFTYHGSYR